MLKRRAASRAQGGFSLIEVVVTVTVLGLILLAAMPSLGNWMDNTRIRNVADALQEGLQLARGEAVRRNTEVSFWLVSLEQPSTLDNDCRLSAASGSWVVAIDSPLRHCGDAPSTTSAPRLVTGRPVGDAGGQVSVSARDTDGAEAVEVRFNGFGRAVNADAIAQIDVNNLSGSGARNLRVAISPAGQVRLCDPNVSDSTDPRKC